MSLNLSSENVLLFPRVRSEDDISDYEETINKIILNLNLNNKVYNNVATRIGCQSPIQSSKFMKYIDKNNNDNDNYSIVSDLTDYEENEKDKENDKYLNEEEEINYKIWPIDYDYMEDYEEGYEDDVSEINGYYSYNSC